MHHRGCSEAQPVDTGTVGARRALPLQCAVVAAMVRAMVCTFVQTLHATSLRQQHGRLLCRAVPQGRHFINRVLQLTDRRYPHSPKSRRDDTLLTVCFSLRTERYPHSPKSRRDDTSSPHKKNHFLTPFPATQKIFFIFFASRRTIVKINCYLCRVF
jgi:hypothetical protein